MFRRLAALRCVNQIVVGAEVRIVFRDDLVEERDRFECACARLLRD